MLRITPEQRTAHHAVMTGAPRWYANLVFGTAYLILAAGIVLLAVTAF